MKEKRRKLIKTFPGLPEGAGIYDDGQFYNCAPGQASQAINHDNDVFYSVIDDQVIFDTDHPQYKNVKCGLSMVGIDIYKILSVDELEYLMSSDMYGESIVSYIRLKQQSRTPRTSFQKMLQARHKGDLEEADRLAELLKKRSALGLGLCQNISK